MTISRKALLMAAAVMALPTASAMADEGWYVSGAGGLNWPEDSSVRGGGLNNSAQLDRGWAASGAFGYKTHGGLRLEGELGYRSSEFDSLNNVAVGGDADVWNLMANAIYDFDVGSSLYPYAGVGLGLARADWSTDIATGGVRIDDDDIGLAYQGIFGFGYTLTPQLTLTADYRFLGVPDLDLSSTAGARIDTEYHAHTLMVGLRFAFSPPPQPAPAPAPKMVEAPPPAPQPAPPPEPEPAAPPPPSTYLVFFDFDVASLSPEALDIVQEAAANASTVNPVRIEVTGHADRSGPTDYNQRLSMRRAQSVMDELVRQGVPASEISVFARGESDPLVPTPDGVREPQNRRVEIVFQ